MTLLESLNTFDDIYAFGKWRWWVEGWFGHSGSQSWSLRSLISIFSFFEQDFFPLKHILGCHQTSLKSETERGASCIWPHYLILDPLGKTVLLQGPHSNCFFGCSMFNNVQNDSQRRVCYEQFTRCHAEIEAAVQTCYLTHCTMTPGQPIEKLTFLCLKSREKPQDNLFCSQGCDSTRKEIPVCPAFEAMPNHATKAAYDTYYPPSLILLLLFQTSLPTPLSPCLSLFSSLLSIPPLSLSHLFSFPSVPLTFLPKKKNARGIILERKGG